MINYFDLDSKMNTNSAELLLLMHIHNPVVQCIGQVHSMCNHSHEIHYASNHNGTYLMGIKMQLLLAFCHMMALEK